MRFLLCLFVLFGASWCEYDVECERCGLLKELPVCTLETKGGTKCKIHIMDIKPTQFALGSYQVFGLARLGQEYVTRQIFEDYLTYYYIPITIGRDSFYLTDKHHFVASISQVRGVALSDKWISAFVNENRNQLNEPSDEFWKYMVETNLVWLYDEAGRGPLDPVLLPNLITELLFDPFRDLAYELKAQDAIMSTSTYFGEFMWANYFRTKIPFPSRSPMPEEFVQWCSVRLYDSNCLHEKYAGITEWILSESVIEKALLLSKSKEAENLPGFVG